MAGMDPLSTPPVLRAKAALDAAESARLEAEKAYVSAVLEAFPTRDEAFAALGLQRRTGFRKLAELGLSAPR